MDAGKLKAGMEFALESLEALLETVRSEIGGGGYKLEEAGAFLERPYGEWLETARAKTASAGGSAPRDAQHKLRAAFLEADRIQRAFFRLFWSEFEARGYVTPALANCDISDEKWIGMVSKECEPRFRDLKQTLEGLRPCLGDPALDALTAAADKAHRAVLEEDRGLDAGKEGETADFNLEDIAEEPAGEKAPDDGEYPIVDFADALLLDASRRLADIHIIPGTWAATVQYERSGHVRPVLELPPRAGRYLITRLKIMAMLDITEYKTPQMGSIAEAPGPELKRFLIRVDTFPTRHRERMVVRFKLKTPVTGSLPEIGLSGKDLRRYEKLLDRKGGLLLHAGLAGTGRTRALLSVLRSLDRRGLSTQAVLLDSRHEAPGLSVSGPVGSDSNGESQLVYLSRMDLSAVLIEDIGRHDGHVKALQLAARGKWILTKSFAQDAPSALLKLLSMIEDPELISSGLAGICGHVMPRCLCTRCKEGYVPSKDELSRLGGEPPERLYRPVGCDRCEYTGFTGCAPAFELLVPGKNVEAALRSEPSADELRKAAAADGMTPAAEGLLERVREGATSLDEALATGLLV